MEQDRGGAANGVTALVAAGGPGGDRERGGMPSPQQAQEPPRR